MTDMISEKDCAKQVRRVGNQVGLLFYHFAKTLVNELGEAEGKRLVLLPHRRKDRFSAFELDCAQLCRGGYDWHCSLG